MRRIATSILVVIVAVTLFAGATLPAGAETLRQMLIERLKEKSAAAPAIDPARYVAGASVQTLHYGKSAEQTLDVYSPPHAHDAPVIVMVHGGGWAIGDKNSAGVVENKLKHWLPQGYLLVSVDYRMLPEARPDVQAEDVAAALAYVEANAAAWGGDAGRIVLMGHSAGAHLVSLLSADPAWVARAGGKPWAGTVVLDSAAVDVVAIMTAPHARLYDDAFGHDPAYWASVSPMAQLQHDAIPMILVCSLKRANDSCNPNKAFASRIKAVTGRKTDVLAEPLTHAEINADVGLPGAYTAAIDAFIAARPKS